MRILITGAGGFVGKRLTRRLAGQGHEIVALVRRDPPQADMPYFTSGDVTLLQVDMADLDCATLPSIDAVFTLAQSSWFRDFPNKAKDVFNVNVYANFKLFQWAVKSGVKRFIYVSSGGVYGERSGAALSEDDTLSVDSPLGFYLSTKLCAEILFNNYRQFFKTAVILRPFFIFGPGQRDNMFVARLIDSVRNRKPITLKGPDGLLANPLYVDDAVCAFANSVELDGYHLINVAGGDVLTLRRIGELIGQAVGIDPVFEMAGGSPADYVARIDQASAKLNLQPTPFPEAIRKTIEGG